MAYLLVYLLTRQPVNPLPRLPRIPTYNQRFDNSESKNLLNRLCGTSPL